MHSAVATAILIVADAIHAVRQLPTAEAQSPPAQSQPSSASASTQSTSSAISFAVEPSAADTGRRSALAMFECAIVVVVIVVAWRIGPG